MIRFILKRAIKDVTNQAEYELFETVDIECKELESKLFERMGFSENGYDVTQLLGVELVKVENDK